MPHDDACHTLADDWSGLIDGELTARREAELRAHLEGCADCAARVEALRGVDRALADLPARDVPSDLRARLQARLDAGTVAGSDRRREPPGGTVAASDRRREPPGGRAPAPRRRALRAPTAALAAAAAVAAALAIYLTVGPRQAGVTRPPTEAPAVARTPEAPEPGARSVDRDFDAVPVEDLAVASELDAIEDLGVISNLELLEMLVALDEEGTG